jgi:predicted GTPase
MTTTAANGPVRTVILGAAGRDFHNFNVLYRDDPETTVVAFTATQIPGIGGRRYPPILAGQRYPDGIPIEEEAQLEAICLQHEVRRVMFAYSDVTHAHVMHLASRALACGADFVLAGPHSTMLRSRRPVIAVSAIRTGCGKSQTSRWISQRVAGRGIRVAVVRHPMPYGDLATERVQRFATLDDLTAQRCTVEEREEYEPHIAVGSVVFAGVDYAAILEAAERECDVVLWDGGNNDFPFFRPDLHIVVADALRPGQANGWHPGEAVLRMADLVVINKANAAGPDQVARVVAELRAINPRAPIVRAASIVTLDDASAVRGRRVLVVEDGPTITHGGMAWGAGYVAAREAGAASVVDPRPWAAPLIRRVYDDYPHIGPVLPAVGYGTEQLAALADTIDRAEADVVIAATPADIARLIAPRKPVVRAHYAMSEMDEPGLGRAVDQFLDRAG